MSFRLFVYYCAVCGAWAAFVGWFLGRAISSPDSEVYPRTILRGLSLGMMLAFGLGVVDGLFSSKQLGAVVLRGVFVAVIGLLGGLLGGALGQFLFGLPESVWLKESLRALGWVLTGLLIGASVGVFDVVARLSRGEGTSGAVRKVVNGVLGGGVGGLIGSLFFIALGLGLGKVFGRPPDQVYSSGAWGMVVLGACIGLFIGLAQVILKEAWVRVEAGFRPGRELILNKDEITIGRAESCDIGLFGGQGVEKVHARILLKGKRYLLADDDTPGGTYLNDERITEPTPLRNGDTIRVGNCVLRFGERAKK
jgi:hypothetical protein